MKNKKPTISIGIPVHNEAENICNLLETIIKQNNTNYNLENIIVICDGTTDGTDKIVKKLSFKHPFIKVFNDGKRKGKMQRLMEIYRYNLSDFIFIFDGDVVLGNKDVLSEMVSKFNGKRIVIVGANNQPVPGNTITGRLINQWSHVWYLARLRYNHGNNIHNIRGCGMAIRKDFAKKIKFPSEIISDAQYIYFYCLSQNMKFQFSPNALILYRKPNNIYDLLLQSRRSEPDEIKLGPIFGEWIYQKYDIPISIKYFALLEAVFSNPILTLMAILFHLYSLRAPHRRIVGNEALWKRPSSTKEPIAVNY